MELPHRFCGLVSAMKKLSLKLQLRLIFIFVLVLVLATSAVSFLSINTTKNTFEGFQHETANAVIISEVQEGMLMARIQAIKYFSESNETHVNSFKAWADTVEKRLSQARRQFTDKENLANIANMQNDFTDYAQSFLRLVETDNNPDLSSQEITQMKNRIISDELNVIGPRMASKLDLAKERITTIQSELGQDVLAVVKTSTTLAVTIAILATVICAFIAVVFPNFILKPVGGEPNEIKYIAEKVAQGQVDAISTTVDNKSGIYKALAKMASELKSVLHDINNASGSVNTLALSLENMASDTSSGAHKQMDTLSQIATAMEQMATTISHVTENAQQAASSASQAKNSTLSGSHSIENSAQSLSQLISHIDDLSMSVESLTTEAQGMSSILNTINEIAEQANLLALNAAIEAARAGEQGRGFAVVADEVRTLASRTQLSTDDIQSKLTHFQAETQKVKALMSDTTKKAQDTREASDNAQQAFELINGAITQIDLMNQQIASSSEEQSAVAKEINDLVIGVNELAQSTSQRALNTTNKAKTLASTATTLESRCAYFSV
jgi:methyl-accepting chemotaxis protein